MKQFEVGKTYSTRSICNADCVLSYTITARTACTVTVVDECGEKSIFRINKRLSEFRNAETFLPWGKYSMAPMITAN